MVGYVGEYWVDSSMTVENVVCFDEYKQTTEWFISAIENFIGEILVLVRHLPPLRKLEFFFLLLASSGQKSEAAQEVKAFFRTSGNSNQM
jgi:hypothetical protein